VGLLSFILFVVLCIFQAVLNIKVLIAVFIVVTARCHFPSEQAASCKPAKSVDTRGKMV